MDRDPERPSQAAKPCPVPARPSPSAGPPERGVEPSPPPDFPQRLNLGPSLDRLGLDRLGLTQAIGGLILGLLALFSSYDHISVAGRTLQLQQQWGIACIAASVATVFIGCVQYGAPLGRDAQLATRARHRSAYEGDRDRDLAREERQRADQERNRAAEARERQAQDHQRQSTELAFLRRSALLSARVQLDPSASNRSRLRAFVTLMAQQPLEGEEAGEA